MSTRPPNDPMLQAAARAAARDSGRSQALLAIANELAHAAQLLLDRANQYREQAGDRQRFLVAVDDSGPAPAPRLVVPDAGERPGGG